MDTCPILMSEKATAYFDVHGLPPYHLFRCFKIIEVFLTGSGPNLNQQLPFKYIGNRCHVY